LSIFVDSSFWFASVVARDRNNLRAKSLLRDAAGCVTNCYVLVETWLLLNSRYHYRGAEQFWDGLRRGAARVEFVTSADLESAWATGQAFPEQEFSLADRTSFAVMERLGLTKVASFDNDFAIYRYGRARDKAFEVVR
jgi:uncharacterized protein